MARGVIFGWLGRLGGGDASSDSDMDESISTSVTGVDTSAIDAFSVGLVLCVFREGGGDAILTLLLAEDG